MARPKKSTAAKPPTKKSSGNRKPAQRAGKRGAPSSIVVHGKRPSAAIPDGIDLPPRLAGENETIRAYAAFVIYLEQPPTARSLRDLATTLGHSGRRVVGGWSARFDWQRRAAAFDACCFAERRRLWHISKAADDLALLERERNASRKARVLLEEQAVGRLEKIIAGVDNDMAAVAAVRELIKVADHAPDRPVEPAQSDRDEGVTAADVVAFLRDAGLSREMIGDIASELISARKRALTPPPATTSVVTDEDGE